MAAVVTMHEYTGSCHCGSLGFRYRTELLPRDWSVRACQCSFCRCHDAHSTSDIAGKLDFIATDGTDLRRFRFGLRTADFVLCRNCDVYIGAVIECGTGRFGIINLHALDSIPDDIAAVAPIDYAGEELAGRVARREQRWTPVVTVPW